MKLIITEKNIAAKKLADILADKKAVADKVYNTAVYRFEHEGVECVAIGLRGHILGVGFPVELEFDKKKWQARWEDDRITPASIPDSLPTPPWPKNVRPFKKTGVVLGTWNIPALPYLIYAPIGKFPQEKDIIRSLKTLAKKSDDIIIATDFDREGELIGADARGLCQEVSPNARYRRARYSAITKEEIQRAFNELTLVDDDLAQAGEARQDIDLVWGAVLTRYLTKVRFSGVGKPRSAGRVQTPTLKLIVDKEAERAEFVPEDYWVVTAALEATDGHAFNARHKTARFTDEAAAIQANGHVQALIEANGSAKVVSVEFKQRKQQPPMPFNTTALQAAAAAEGLSPSRTMRIAETLYMNGLISYPRVDNTVYPPSLNVRDILKELTKVDAYRGYAEKLLAKGQLTATRGNKETTDHPPIHPTGAANPDSLKPEEFKLYNLVARRFMATFSDIAVYQDTVVGLDIASEPFEARGAVLSVPGFRAIYPYGSKKDDELPPIEKDDLLKVTESTLEGKQTKPPARYSEGSIITMMEKLGLGTKATRHDIVQRLVDRAYVQVEDKNLKPTMLGVAVIEALTEFAPRITTPDMTSDLEAEMDQIAGGDRTRVSVVDHSRQMLANVMVDLIDKAAEVGERLKDAAIADAKVGECPTCGKDLLVRNSPKTKSQFVGCAGWPECEVTYPLPQGKIDPLPDACVECGAPRVRIIQFRSKPIERCLNPACVTNFEAPVDLGACPVCPTLGKEGRIIGQRNPATLKRYARCTNFEECDTSYPLPGKGDLQPTHEYCPACGSPEVVVTTTRGPWRICINMQCPLKAEEAEKKAARAAGATKPKAKPKAKARAKPKAKPKASAKRVVKRTTKTEAGAETKKTTKSEEAS